MTSIPAYSPIFALTRGGTVESVHYGAIAVVDIKGRLIAGVGDPELTTFTRSSAKPFQVLPLLVRGGKKYYDLTDREIAIMCASHSGTDNHLEVIQQLQHKTGVSEHELLCGVHYPIHKPTADAMRANHEKPTPNRHNCSGKHTGMCAFVRLLIEKEGQGAEGLPYIDPSHPIQEEIFSTFARVCGLRSEQIAIGIDGCSAPIFAAPLRNIAWGYAQICDPNLEDIGNQAITTALRQVAKSMINHPDMVAGPDRFDTELMKIGRGKFVAKGGAEAFQGIGLMPDAIAPGSSAIGIAIKISDGDKRLTVRSAVTVEVLRQLGALSSDELRELSVYSPHFPVKNWRGIVVGEAYPLFSLNANEL